MLASPVEHTRPSECLRGLAAVGGRLACVLDVVRVLSRDRLFVSA